MGLAKRCSRRPRGLVTVGSRGNHVAYRMPSLPPFLLRNADVDGTRAATVEAPTTQQCPAGFTLEDVILRIHLARQGRAC